jgi:transaldolase
MGRLTDLNIKIFADSADLGSITKMAKNPLIKGFTTNPSLMHKAGVNNYEVFARRVLAAVNGLPVSFEVFADDFATMAKQARIIASWGPNVNVKIPAIDSRGHSNFDLIYYLSASVPLNVTAVFTFDQMEAVAAALHPEASAIVSVFAGRIADTGVDPVPAMQIGKKLLSRRPNAQLLWASTRELLNIFQADECGCDIITVTPEILSKLDLVGKDLTEYSRETVQEFYRSGTAEFQINSLPAAAE